MFEQGVEMQFRKEHEENDNLPESGLARDTRARFERGEVLHAEGTSVARDDLDNVHGAASASKAAYQAATERTEVKVVDDEYNVMSDGYDDNVDGDNDGDDDNVDN